MFKIRLSINQAVLQRLRDLPDRAQRNLRQKVQTQLKPELQADVDALMETPPGPVSSPFMFGTDKSKRYYFVLIRENPDMTDGSHYIRTGDTAASFEVRVSDRLRESLISITNRKSGAPYVYGPYAVQGHINTGWPEQAQVARRKLQNKARLRVVGYWREAVREGLRGEG